MIRMLARLLVPDRCALCNIEGWGVCPTCQSTILLERTPSCYLCNALTSRGQVCKRCQSKTPIRQVWAVWRLTEAASRVVYALKYEGREAIARTIGYKFQMADLPTYDIITYVPSVPRRKRDKGFNAPELVARELSRLSGLPVIQLLRRDVHIPQVGKGRVARWKNVAGSFSAENIAVLQKQRILLIDDVVTTGATITECAKTLKAAGSGAIYVAAAAKR